MSLPLAPEPFNDEIDFLPNNALMLGRFILIALLNDPAPPIDDVEPEGDGVAEPPDLDDAVVDTDKRCSECLFAGVDGEWEKENGEEMTGVPGLEFEAETRECGLEAGDAEEGKTTRSSSPEGIGSDIHG